MDSTPLLSAIGGLPGPNTMQDHPPFLRASHSPWRFIPQNILVILRGIVLAYLTATGIMASVYKLTLDSDYTNWRFVFDFAVISFIMTFVYHAIAFSWTFTHLYYPHPDDNEGGIEGWFIWLMSLPSNMASLRKQFHFTMFYTATCVFCFMNSTIYWLITRQQAGGSPGSGDPAPPQSGGASVEGVVWGWDTVLNGPLPDAPFSDLFGEGWFKPFNIFSLYAIPSIIMVFEILFLNSIKRPYAIGSHMFGLMFLSGMYLGWAAIGQLLTGWYSFDWLDEAKVGSGEAVTAYCIGFVLLAPILYILMQGFVGIREGLTRSLAESRATAAAQESLEG